MKENLQDRINKAKTLLNSAECVIIGGGAGLSAAAGLTYSGQRFTDNFAEYIQKYGMTDMYTSSFYPFRTQEEKWAYWSRHILVNRYLPPALPLYKTLFELVKDKDYFVLTTNVDYQFYKAGFSPDRIFAVQGDYGKIQCAKDCHDKLYDNEELIIKMNDEQKDCKVPSHLVPKCPVCGGDMEVNVRKDAFFVQDDAWYAANEKYEKFYDKACEKRTVLLELGVGFNTPTIIRFPFERMTYNCKGVHLIRINADYPEAISENAEKTVSFDEDMKNILYKIKDGKAANQNK